LWVGWPAMKAILGNKLIPRLLDRYLARTGFDSQQTDEPTDPNRRDNLFEPVDDTEDRGSHGGFDDRARPRSYQWLASANRGVLALVGTGLAAVAAATALKR
jgi:hypothetical protein